MSSDIIYRYVLNRYIGDTRVTRDCYSGIILDKEHVAMAVGLDPYDSDAMDLIDKEDISYATFSLHGENLSSVIFENADAENRYDTIKLPSWNDLANQ